MTVEVWQNIKDILKTKIDESKMKYWIECLDVQLNDGKLVVVAPNTMIKQYVERFFLKDIIEAASKLSSSYTISLEVLGNNVPSKLAETKIVNNIVNNIVDKNSKVDDNLTFGRSEITKTERSVSSRSGNSTKRSVTNRINIFSRSKSSSEQNEESKYKYIKTKTFDNFVQGSSNSVAFMAAESVAVAPGKKDYNPLILLGKSGLGKTHLLYAIGNKICDATDLRVVYVSSNDFLQDFTQIFGNSQAHVKNSKLEELNDFYSSADVLLIDDIQFIAKGEKTQEQFFNIIKNFFENLKQIVVTCDTYPKEVEKLDQRIVSRLAEGVTLEITVPQYEERVSIIASKAKEQKLKIPKEQQQYIARIVVSNVREIEGALKNIKATCKFKGTNEVTTELVKEALAKLIQAQERLINSDEIMRIVAQKFGCSINQFKSAKKYRSVSYPRNLAMYIIRELTKKSYEEIGETFGGKDHSTVVAAHRKIGELIKNDPKVNEDYQSIINLLKI